MSTAEKIYQEAQELPDEAQRAILQIVELLRVKKSEEDEAWSELSLAGAMAGMEDEQWPDYTQMPCFEKWR